MDWSQITSSITGKVVLTITPLEWLVLMNIIFDRNTGAKTKWLFESNLNYSCFKSFTGLGFYAFQLWPHLQRECNYTKCLVALHPDVIFDAQNRTLKKTEVGFKQILDMVLARVIRLKPHPIWWCLINKFHLRTHKDCQLATFQYFWTNWA